MRIEGFCSYLDDLLVVEVAEDGVLRLIRLHGRPVQLWQFVFRVVDALDCHHVVGSRAACNTEHI